jgi:DNA-binding transcriptional LysR family regulator
MAISYDYYKIFYYVASYHSINKAAAILQNSQPNISRSIAALESQLGCRLFNRSSKGVELTDAGNELFVHVEAAYRHLKNAEELILSTTDLTGGIIKIGISNGITRGVIHELFNPVIRTFHNMYPDVKMEILHKSSPLLTSYMDDDLIDIAFVTIENIDKMNLKKSNCEIIHSYNDIAIAGTEFTGLSHAKVSLDELNDYPMIGLGEETETFNFYKRVFLDKRIEYRPSVITITTDQILSYCIDNLGVGFIHPRDAQVALENKQIFRVDLIEDLPVRRIVMIKNDKGKRVSVIFEQMLKEHMQKRRF